MTAAAQAAIAAIKEAIAMGPRFGPWHWAENEFLAVLDVYCFDGESTPVIARVLVDARQEATARFIAACNPEAVAAILAERESDKARIAELEAECERLKLAIAGGEDAPGYAAAQPVSIYEKIAEENRRRSYDDQYRIAELEAARDAHAVVRYGSFGVLLGDAVTEAQKAMRKFPQPNYVVTKIAEEAGEVVKAAVHCAEGRETPEKVRGEMVQLIAMLYRMWIEGDQVHGLRPLSGGGGNG